MKNVKPLDRANSDRFDEAGESRSDWTRLRTTSDADVEAAVRSSDDEDGMLVDWQNARLVTPTRKESMTIRLDADILAYYRGLGRGYQTTINAVLRSFMEHAHAKDERR